MKTSQKNLALFTLVLSLPFAAQSKYNPFQATPRGESAPATPQPTAQAQQDQRWKQREEERKKNETAARTLLQDARALEHQLKSKIDAITAALKKREELLTAHAKRCEPIKGVSHLTTEEMVGEWATFGASTGIAIAAAAGPALPLLLAMAILADHEKRALDDRNEQLTKIRQENGKELTDHDSWANRLQQTRDELLKKAKSKLAQLKSMKGLSPELEGEIEKLKEALSELK